jgi:hypothetical protein
MDSANRKRLKSAYQDRPVVGGVYMIACAEADRRWIKSTKNLEGQQNQFAFSASTNLCPDPGMREEWNRYGMRAFSFSVLEELRKKEGQTDRAFAEDLELLLQMWLEKNGA